jgi:cytochrome c553
MKFIFTIIVAMAVLAARCERKDPAVATIEQDSITNCIKPKQKVFEMYTMSPMAALMEQMYVENSQLKQRIIAGESVGEFPNHIIAIHSAAMTDKDDNDAFFKQQAEEFINAQQLIYNDPANAKEHFNNAVSSCIACHEGKCEGPIPRIKKLYIK